MKNLASLRSKKPSKPEAQAILRNLYDQYPDAGPDLAKLYQYFMPTVPKRPKTDWDWVAQAAGVKDVRHYLNYVYVTEDWITATDGHRLHRAPNVTHMTPGFYLTNGDMAHPPEWAIYPDVNRVIPNNMYLSRFDLEQVDIEEVTDKIWAYVLRPSLYVAIGINKVYLDAAVGNNRCPDLEYKTGTDPIRYYELRRRREAVIMPMRL